MSLRKFIKDQQLGSAIRLTDGDQDDELYHVQQKDWDVFIERFQGVDCQKMCDRSGPIPVTRRLFGNAKASHVFCRWCRK